MTASTVSLALLVASVCILPAWYGVSPGFVQPNPEFRRAVIKHFSDNPVRQNAKEVVAAAHLTRTADTFQLTIQNWTRWQLVVRGVSTFNASSTTPSASATSTTLDRYASRSFIAPSKTLNVTLLDEWRRAHCAHHIMQHSTSTTHRPVVEVTISTPAPRLIDWFSVGHCYHIDMVAVGRGDRSEDSEIVTPWMAAHPEADVVVIVMPRFPFGVHEQVLLDMFNGDASAIPVAGTLSRHTTRYDRLITFAVILLIIVQICIYVRLSVPERQTQKRRQRCKSD